MTQLGKHAKGKEAPVVSGKHAGEVRTRIDFSQIALMVLLVAALIVIPFSFNRIMVAMDNPALLGQEADALSPITEAVEEATGLLVGGSVQPNLAEAAMTDAETLAASLPEAGYTQRVRELRQEGYMSGGCELVSLAIALDAMGLDSDIHRVAAECLNVDGHFATGYSGNPYQKGGGYPAGIVEAANEYLAELGSLACAQDLTGVGFDMLAVYVSKGYPVLVWTTMGYEPPAFSGVFDGDAEWYSNEHCVVLYGFEDGQALVSDPLEGLICQEVDGFAQLYRDCGSMAAVIL